MSHTPYPGGSVSERRAGNSYNEREYPYHVNGAYRRGMQARPEKVTATAR